VSGLLVSGLLVAIPSDTVARTRMTSPRSPLPAVARLSVCPVAPVTPTTPAAPAPPAARRGPAPTITAKIAKRLKLSRRGSLSFLVTDSESTSGRATGTISLPKHAKVVRFKTAKFKVGPGKLTKVTLKLSARSLKSVRRVLKHHKLKANITLTLGQTVKKLHTALKS